MDATINELVKSLVDRLGESKDRRILIGLSGVPGSGKSLLGSHVVQALNRQTAGLPTAVLVGMDGWHLTRAQLEAMPDPQLAKDRRGAAWTFDDHVRSAGFDV